MAGTAFYILSNNGQETLASAVGLADKDYTVSVTSTGVSIVYEKSGIKAGSVTSTALSYVYDGASTFLGISTSPNASTPTIPIGGSTSTNSVSGTYTYYIVEEASAVDYDHLLHDGNKIQVDSAIRDGNGVKIDTNYALKTYVDDAIEALPEPMLFKGTLGTGGTITSLPTASASNEGYVYKVITAGTYASQAAKIGDLFICANTSTTSTPSYAWTYVPSGDDSASGVTNVATGVGLTGGPITTSGTIKAKLKSETNATYDSNSITNTSGKQYAVVPDKTNGYLSVNVPWTDENVGQTDITGSEDEYDAPMPLIFTEYDSQYSDTIIGYVDRTDMFTVNPAEGQIIAPHFYNSTTNSSLDFIVGSTFQLTEVD